MKVLCVNVPNVHTRNGVLYTGPNSGSRWPWSAPSEMPFHGYAPYPFRLAYTVAYLRNHGITADLYDGVADRHANFDQVRTAIYNYKPDIALFDVSTPCYDITNEMALWTKNTLGCKIVFCGTHMKKYAAHSKAQAHVDHVISGEMERPMLDIVETGGKGTYEYMHLEKLDKLPDGTNFLPHREWEGLNRYYDPSMETARMQVQVNTSRACPFSCTYCTTSRVFENAPYRARSAEMVVDELQTIKNRLGGALGSFFFDDDTWNIGNARIKDICKGLKDIGVPWTMMGRIDTSTHDLYDIMVNSGCVGMRFGIESFDQRLLDNAKKSLSAKTTYDNIKYLLTRFSGLEFHFTTMKNLPGAAPDAWEKDKAILQELIKEGAKNNNRVHYQNSECVPFPGTELWEELVELGHGDKIADFHAYDGHPDHNQSLIKTIGLLGRNYAAKKSKWSDETGGPIGLPSS